MSPERDVLPCGFVIIPIFFSRSHDVVIHVYDVSGLRRGKPISVTYVK
jgi:hypothetical protein